ncbi:unnamed protein product [Sympodiomycopsis kandeliae]
MATKRQKTARRKRQPCAKVLPTLPNEILEMIIICATADVEKDTAQREFLIQVIFCVNRQFRDLATRRLFTMLQDGNIQSPSFLQDDEEDKAVFLMAQTGLDEGNNECRSMDTLWFLSNHDVQLSESFGKRLLQLVINERASSEHFMSTDEHAASDVDSTAMTLKTHLATKSKAEFLIKASASHPRQMAYWIYPQESLPAIDIKGQNTMGTLYIDGRTFGKTTQSPPLDKVLPICSSADTVHHDRIVITTFCLCESQDALLRLKRTTSSLYLLLHVKEFKKWQHFSPPYGGHPHSPGCSINCGVATNPNTWFPQFMEFMSHHFGSTLKTITIALVDGQRDYRSGTCNLRNQFISSPPISPTSLLAIETLSQYVLTNTDLHKGYEVKVHKPLIPAGNVKMDTDHDIWFQARKLIRFYEDDHMLE